MFANAFITFIVASTILFSASMAAVQDTPLAECDGPQGIELTIEASNVEMKKCVGQTLTRWNVKKFKRSWTTELHLLDPWVIKRYHPAKSGVHFQMFLELETHANYDHVVKDKHGNPHSLGFGRGKQKWIGVLKFVPREDVSFVEGCGQVLGISTVEGEIVFSLTRKDSTTELEKYVSETWKEKWLKPPGKFKSLSMMDLFEYLMLRDIEPNAKLRYTWFANTDPRKNIHNCQTFVAKAMKFLQRPRLNKKKGWKYWFKRVANIAANLTIVGWVVKKAVPLFNACRSGFVDIDEANKELFERDTEAAIELEARDESRVKRRLNELYCK